MSRPLALVGLPAVGKTTIAALLADRLGVESIDLDDVVVSDAGQSIPEIFENEGEVGFRHRESEALRSALQPDGPGVVACGGGVVIAAGNREVLAERACCIWLTAPLGLLADRARELLGSRPLLDGDLDRQLVGLAAERDPLYRSVADLVVDVAGMQPAQVVDRIVEGLGADA